MKHFIILFTFLFGLAASFSCKFAAKDDKQKSTELRTTQTLGLAYLEEFKLAEAEKEFLKFIKLAPGEKLGYANLGLTYLRMGKYPEAKKQLQKAIRIDPKDPDIRLILATVCQMNEEKQQAVAELQEALKLAPGHVKVLYALTEIISTLPDKASESQRNAYMQNLAEKASGNLVPQLGLAEIYIRDRNDDKAIEQLENIRKQFPDFPKEAVEYFNKTISLLRKKDFENATVQFTIFHNYLKVSNPYQAGMMDLKGPGGSLIGFPLITFDQQTPMQTADDKPIMEIIRFTDVTESAGLNIVKPYDAVNDQGNGYSTFSAAADYDSDGDIDLYVASYDAASSSCKYYLLKNEMGRFTDVSAEAGLKHSGTESSAIFADYDNDGFLDLYMVKENGDVLYRNAGVGIFKNVTADSKIKSNSGGNKALFFDFDHDGDLDLFETGKNSNLAFRNNGDGTFQEQAEEMGLAGKGSRDAAFGDFDDDGDIDIMVVLEGGQCSLYSNQRQGRFINITTESGLIGVTNVTSVTVADYNNDGFSDIFIPSSGGDNNLFFNKGDGTFEKEKNTEELTAALKQIKALDAKFLDFDNDGFLDLIVSGEPLQKDGRGLFLFHNDKKGVFKDVSHILPENVKSGRQITLFDYNDDGDPDMVIAGLNGGISLLRNDGGNMNHYVKMKLVGLKAGSAKNNHFGIGAKVELRAGDLYQTMVVTDSEIHFGLGARSRADIIRITWTNGVPQNIFLPGADQALLEAQTLKGSCPFLYTWNGKEYEFVKDITWRSALGMPTGIMGGATRYAFPDASDDYIKIPGEMLEPENGAYKIQITSELWETIYMDRIQLVAIDHPDSTEIFVPEQFTPPPFPGSKIYHVAKKYPPVSAVDHEGNDQLSTIREKDDKYISGFISSKYQGVTEMHDLILDPGEAGRLNKLCLLMTGWIFPTDASINVAISQSEQVKVVPPNIQVRNEKGEWQTVIDFFGFPMGKDKTVIVDLSGKFLSADHRIRIQTNMEIYWDQIFFSDGSLVENLPSTSLEPSSADIHYRGFSRSFRKGGRYGPHWFDYQSVETGVKWRDLTGNYTRYGDVKPLLLKSDNKYIISNAGDETTVRFDATALPPLEKGWKRDFLIHSVGWVKDGDLNTATGNSVEPLPYHGMLAYPPSGSDSYPADPELEKYNREYNTRKVTSEPFRKSFSVLSVNRK